MNIDKDANLGSGNIIQEITIGTVHHFYSNAQKVIIPEDVDKDEVQVEKAKAKSPKEMRELPPIREQIMLYVSCLNTEDLVAPHWLSRYMDLWDKIIDIPEVAAMVYNPGKQQHTTFNRNLVANIIYYLGNRIDAKQRVFKDYNATLFAERLEADKEHPVRAALGKNPTDDIKQSLDRFMENYLL